jgi:hypothetical protein
MRGAKPPIMPGTGRIVMLAVSAAALVSLTACADMVGNTNREVVSSTQFDNIPCK